MMKTLNHINLTSTDVPELTRFFEECFAFRLVTQRGAGKFSVMEDDSGFQLTLMHGSESVYPGMFHVGFLLESEEDVRRTRVRIVGSGFDVPAAGILTRGGPKTFGFYCIAPGGVMVEVSTAAE